MTIKHRPSTDRAPLHRYGFAMALAAIFVGGCADPIVGEWESEQELVFQGADIGKITLEIDDDLEGDGATSVGGCTFDVEVSDEGDDKYEMEWGASSCGMPAQTHDCELDEDTLECDLPGLKIDFERQD